MIAAGRVVPPYPAGIVELLRARGHTVALRVDRNGSFRYRVDRRPEWKAIQMSRFYERTYEAPRPRAS